MDPALIAVGAVLLAARLTLNAAYDRGYADAKLAYTTAAATAVVADTEQRGGITYYWGEKAETNQAQLRAYTNVLLTEIPKYVTPQADAGCTVPVGFVRLHNAAASGDSLAVPAAAAQPNDAASGVALSAVAGTVVDNYGVCHSIRQNYIDLQGWVKEQRAAAP